MIVNFIISFQFILQAQNPDNSKDGKLPDNNLDKSVKNKEKTEIINNLEKNVTINTSSDNNNNNINKKSEINTTTLDALPIKNPTIEEKVIEKPPIKIYPIIKALRGTWYKPAKELYFWDMDIQREDITELVW